MYIWFAVTIYFWFIWCAVFAFHFFGHSCVEVQQTDGWFVSGSSQSESVLRSSLLLPTAFLQLVPCHHKIHIARKIKPPYVCVRATEQDRAQAGEKKDGIRTDVRKTSACTAPLIWQHWLRLHGLQSPDYEPCPDFDHIRGTVFPCAHGCLCPCVKR